MNDLSQGNIAGYLAHEAAAYNHNTHNQYRGATAGMVLGAAALGGALLAPRTYAGQVHAAPTTTVTTYVQAPAPVPAPLQYVPAPPQQYAPPQPPQQYAPAPPYAAPPQQYAPAPQQYAPQQHFAPAPPAPAPYAQQYAPLPPQQQQQQQQPPPQPQYYAAGGGGGKGASAAPAPAAPAAYQWRIKSPLELSLTPAFEGQTPHPTQRAHDGAPLYTMMEYVAVPR
jgi:hypothetical protein